MMDQTQPIAIIDDLKIKSREIIIYSTVLLPM